MTACPPGFSFAQGMYRVADRFNEARTGSRRMFYYSYFRGKGRDMLAGALGADDPFRMLPYEILERVLACGDPPQVDSQKANLWRDLGQVYEIRLAKRNFLVAISCGTEEINVQEIRTDAYDAAETAETKRPPLRSGLDDGTRAEEDRKIGAM